MKKIILMSTVLLAGLSACEDYNDQFNIDYDITDIKTGVTIQLASSDYGTIAGMEANKELALSKDPEGQSYVTALEAIGENKYFADATEAEWYLPAFIDYKYPNADTGSRISVQYNMYRGQSGYLADFKKISDYTLTNNDYRSVWNGTSTATYLSPSTLRQIPSVLESRMENPQEGDMVAVNYAYSEFEPGAGGGVIPVVYQQVNDFEGEAGNYVIAAKANDGNYYPFGKLDDSGKNYGYIYPDAITVTDGVISSDNGADQVVTIEEGSEGYLLLNNWSQYIYMSGTYDNFNFSASAPTEGGEWAIEANGDGTFKLKNIEKGKTVKLTLYNGSYSYGSYAASRYTYFEDPMKEETGLFTIKDVTLPEGSTFVWSHDSKYGYYKASAFVNDTNLPAESWLVSSEIDLSEAQNPVLNFDFAFNYLNGNNASDFMKVKVSTDYAGDVKTATWIDLTYDGSRFNRWDFITQSIDLAQYAGKKITLAFAYKSTDQCAPAAEIKNLAIVNGQYWDVCLFKEVPESEVAAQMLQMSRASGAYANTAALYVYREGAWSEYTNEDANVVVADPAMYAELGADYVSRPANVFPIYLVQKFPFAAKGDKAAVVYRADAEGTMAVTEYTYDAGWSASQIYSARTTTFEKTAEGYVAMAGTYLNESLVGDEGGFIIQDISMQGVNYVWKNDATYGWKASAYYNNTNYPAESWLVSPTVDLSEAMAPQLSFEEAHRYLNGEALTDHFLIKISTDYVDNVESCTWEDLTYDETQWSDGQTWDFYPVGPYDLSAYVGQTIRIAFVYISNSTAAPTWEFKNIVVNEAE